jgi:two-component system, chemotaxis family, CheB/CheR fusion protein
MMVIYIVDDNDLIRATIRTVVELRGFSAVDYASAEDFLREARPDALSVLLLDVNMPGMSGLDLLDKMHADGNALPTIVMTVGWTEAIRRAVERAGAPLLRKPFTPDELKCAIEKVLRCRRQTVEADGRGLAS